MIWMILVCVFVHILFNVHIHRHMYPYTALSYQYFVEVQGFIIPQQPWLQEAFSLAVEQKWITLLLLLLALRALQRAAVDPPPPMSRGGRRGGKAEMFPWGMKHEDETWDFAIKKETFFWDC